MALVRALLGFSVVVLTGCSRTDLSLLRVGDSPGSGTAAPDGVPTFSPPKDAAIGVTSEASVTPTPTVTPTSVPPPSKPPAKPPKPNGPGDAGSDADGSVLQDGGLPTDAGHCDVTAPVPGRLVGIWSWNDELALAFWNTFDGTFTNQTLGVPGSAAALAQGPGELAVARLSMHPVDGGGVMFADVYRVAVGADSGARFKSSVRVRADGGKGVSVVWTGERYLLAWIDSTSVWTQRISRDGNVDGYPQVAFEGHPVSGITLASRVPGEVALLCEDYDTIRGAFFAMLDEFGAPASAPVWVTGTDHSVNHRLVATRSGYAASYIQNTNDAFVVTFSSKGEFVARSQVDTACFSQWTCEPSSVTLHGGSVLATNGCEIALVYNVPLAGESRGLRLAKLSEDGVVLQSGIAVAERKLTVWPRLGWDGAHNRWGVAWSDYNSRNTVYAAVGSGGVEFSFQSLERGTFPAPSLVFVPDGWR